MESATVEIRCGCVLIDRDEAGSKIRVASKMNDRRIYLEFFFREGEHFRQRWYVIEERAGGDEELAEEAERPGLKGWVRQSKTDRFNRLHLPNLPVELDSNGLAVKDSRLFIIGGYHHLLPPADSSDDGDEFMGFYSIDLKNATNPEWQLTNLVVKTDNDDLDAVTNGTLVYGRTDLGLIPRWDESPAPRLQLFRGELPFDPLNASVVALTETQLYMFKRSPGRLFCCDLKSRLWKTIDEESWAPWSSSGVVMEDKYLLFFGSRGTDNVPGLYIYDIHSEKWLPKLVQGLPNDEISLPTLDPCGYGIADSFLIQVGRDEPKFAVVWSYQVGLSQSQVHWSKFIIHCTSRNSNPPFFFAEPLSHGGVCFGGNIRLTNSTT